MKAVLYILISFAVAPLFLITGCSTKFNTVAPYKNITIVYGLLDMADTAHYIRIEKAFLDQDKSAFTMAKVPDSNFYAHLNVRIERYDFSGSAAWIDTIHLNRVDLDKEGYPKQPGIFYTAPNFAYKFTGKLDSGYIYRLMITNPVTGETDSAETPIIINGNNAVFAVGILDERDPEMDFGSLVSQLPFKLGGEYYNPINNFSFNGQNSPVGVAQANIRFNWTDSNILTHALTNHYYDYTLDYIAPGDLFSYAIPHSDLYAALFAGMGNAPANTYRLIGKCDISVFLSTPDFYTYQQAGLMQGTGLTGNTIEPVATNIKGAHALGLFTAKAFRTGKVAIDQETIDSLMQGALFQKAMIVGTSY